MKKNFYTIKMKLSVCLLVLMTCLGTVANAQTTLSAGDIAFTGYNSNDGSGGLQNQFSFVLLTNISAGTTINFTDNGYKVTTSTFNTAEGTLVWTSSTAMARFTQVNIQANTTGNGILSLSAGSIAGGFSNFILSQAGDQVLAYQGTAGSPTFISGIHMNSDPTATQAGWDNMAAGTTLTQNRSDVPPSLVSGSTCIAPDPNIGSSERDNGVYNCTGATGASVGAVRTSINTPANWSIQDVTPYTIPPSCTFSTASPLSATISGTNVLCNGANTGAASVSASAGIPAYSYAWAPSGGSGATATGLTAGNYTCTITDATSTQITRTISITQPASALATSTAVTNVVCNGGSNGVASISASGGTGGYSYLWSNGGTTSAITGLLANAYTATVTDANSCTSIKSAIVTQPSALATTTAVTNVACNGGSNGVASISASGGVGGYTYLWSNGATTSAITGRTFGVYTATVTDANSCTSIKSANITQPTALVTSTAVTNVACNGGSNGVASISASGGAGGYTYLWSNGATTSAITGLLQGVYTATVTDANSCTSIKSANVTQPTALTTSTAVTNVACSGGSNGVASITASGGAGGYTYLWSNGATTSAITGLLQGAYTATVTDANSCTSIKSANVTQPTALTTSTAVTNVACNGGSNGVASITASGGAGGYTYLWSNGATTSAITGLLQGVYTATVTDANSCTSIKSANVTQPTALTTSTAVTNVACNGGSNGVASITASGGAGGYTYLWSNGATTSAITGLLQGAYTATVTDANSCTSIKSANVTQPTALTTSTAVTNVACNGGSNGVASITASGGAGGYTYLWSNGATTSAITGIIQGVYTATVTDANSCTSIKSANVTQPTALVTTTAVTTIACNGGSNGSATITASGGAGGYTYLWSNGATTSAISGIMQGVYTATVTDANSCTSIKSANVTQPTALLTTTAVTNVACNGGSNGVASITASAGAGGYTYLWSNGATTSAITGLLQGAYTATVTDANSCTSIKSANVTQPTALLTSTAVTNVACNGGSNGVASINAGGGAGSYTYLWSNGATTSTITGLTFGVYTATVTDANSCTSIKSVNVNQPTALVTTTAVTNLACNGGSNGSATITASGGAGGYTYLWSNGATTSAVSGLLSGAYSATVTDVNSCTSIKSFSISQPTGMTTTTLVANVSCNGGSNGSATITATGGTGGYTYLWSNGATTSAITGLTFGVYTATVTDANSCTSIKSANVTQPTALTTSTAVTNVACNGGSNGVASITASGGTGGYTYLWSNGATTSAITGLVFGVYTATVTDANSCTSIKSSNVTQPTALATTTAVTNVSCNSGSNGSATITATGGTTSYTYLWSNGATTSAVSGLLSGAYSATVTDANSCTSIKSFSISQPTGLTTTTLVTNVSCNSGSNGSATITATGGTGGYTYLWSNGATTSAITGLTFGVYTATVTDANSCTSIKSANVTQPTALVTTTAVTNVLCNGGTGSATITATGGTGTYTYLWSNGATTSATSGLIAGAYSATVTDANTCTSSKGINITQPASALVTTTAITNALCGSPGSATITATGGTGAYTYLWTSGATTSVAPGLIAGAYTATVTDANGCTSVKSVSITQPSSLATATAVINAVCYGGTGSATITASGGVSGYTYLWSNGATTSAVTGLLSGIYTATVTDASNCTATKSAFIAQPAAIAIATTVANVSCNGSVNGSATITATGGTGAYTYSWSSGATTSVVSGFGAGVYTITVTDVNNCTGINSVSITQPSALTLTATAQNPTICSGSTTTLTANGNGGTGTITYTWTSGPATGTYVVSPTVSTVYTVTASDANNCSLSKTVSVNALSLPTITVNNPTICAGSSATIIPNGANTYTISGGSNIVSPAVTSTYAVTGTGANGCASSNTAISTVLVNATPTVAINSGAVCPGNSFTLIPSGANTYTITGGIFTVTPSANTSYSLTGTDINGCVAGNTAVATVSVVNTLTVSVSGATNVCSGRATTLTAIGASSYTWSTGITTNTIALSPSVNTTYTVYGVSGTCSNNAVVTLSVLTTPTVTVNSATICSGSSVVITPTGSPTYTITGGSYTVSPNTTTSYSVTGTSTNGCISNPAVATISVNTTPTLTVNSATICSGNTLAIVPQGAGTYTITGGSFTVSPNALTSYSVTGTGTNGCIASNTAVSTVSVKTTPTVSVNSASICAGSSLVITPTGATTYTISGGSFTVSPLTTTNYSVTGTSTNGCISANVIASVTAYALPTITVNSGVICTGGSFTLIPTGAATYTFSNGSNVIVNPAATADYSVTGTSAQGCHTTNTAVATVSVVSSLVISVTGNTAICIGQTATLTANGANTYSWSTGDVTSTVEFTPTATTDYTVYGASGTCSNTAVVSVSVNPLPTITVNSGTICSGTPFVITPAGASTYSINGNTFTVTPATTESYTVTGTDLNGCVSAEVTSTVAVNALPVVTASASNATVCVNATTSLTAGGATTYSWSTGQPDAVIVITSSVSGTETYTVYGTDANGCIGTATVSQITDECLGINTLNRAAILAGVYPNPNTGNFIVETSEKAQITVINSVGQAVYSQITTGTKTNVSINHLANGIYFVKVIANGNQQVIKVIKE